MPEKLKDMFFTKESINHLGDTFKKYYPKFDKPKFMNLVFDDNFDSLELKQKMRHTTQCMFETLPKSYNDAVEILKQVMPAIKGFEVMSFPDYVELYGMEDWDLSLPALGYFTKFGSSEFAIRLFLDKDPTKVMAYMLKWANDKDEKVRRFSSEGCRPRLPWAMALPKFKKDPSLIFSILEKLKNDESEFVRRSVANNLNDISKDNPEIVLDICEKWISKTDNTDWIVKHACRTMLKAGNKRAMKLFGYGDPSKVDVENFKFEKEKINIGDYLFYTFEINIKEKENKKVRLEYGVYFMKANGKLSKKVFKITENIYNPGNHSFKRKHRFADMSTRKHYSGEHQISIIINGVEKAKRSFQLL
jgi:3-methyladenine DNA glycosylase AlkC